MSSSPHLPPAPSRGCRSPVSCCPESAWGLSGSSGILEQQENLPHHAQADYSLALAHSPEFFLFTEAHVTRGLHGGPDQPRALTGG